VKVKERLKREEKQKKRGKDEDERRRREEEEQKRKKDGREKRYQRSRKERPKEGSSEPQGKDRGKKKMKRTRLRNNSKRGDHSDHSNSHQSDDGTYGRLLTTRGRKHKQYSSDASDSDSDTSSYSGFSSGTSETSDSDASDSSYSGFSSGTGETIDSDASDASDTDTSDINANSGRPTQHIVTSSRTSDSRSGRYSSGGNKSESRHGPTRALVTRQAALTIHGLIFKDDRFLRVSRENNWNYLFAGKTLLQLYRGDTHLPYGDQHFIAFVPFDPDGDLVYKLDENTQGTPEEKIKMLRDCLKDHTYNPDTCEATIPESNIILNIWSWATLDSDCTVIERMKERMFFDRGARDGKYGTYTMSKELPRLEWTCTGWDGMKIDIPQRPRFDDDTSYPWCFVDGEYRPPPPPVPWWEKGALSGL